MSARPQPVASASAIIGVLATIVAGIVSVGIVPAATGDAVLSFTSTGVPIAIAAFAFVHTVIVYFTAAKTTTPVADPMATVTDANGVTVLEPLVPASFTQIVTHDAEGTTSAPPVSPDTIQSNDVTPVETEGAGDAGNPGDQLTFPGDPGDQLTFPGDDAPDAPGVPTALATTTALVDPARPGLAAPVSTPVG